MNFKVGQKVVCVRPREKLVRNRVYVISGIFVCSGCNGAIVDVGVSSMAYWTRCLGCGALTPTDGKRWYWAVRFAPLKFDSAHNEIIEKFPIKEEILDGKDKVKKVIEQSH